MFISFGFGFDFFDLLSYVEAMITCFSVTVLPMLMEVG